MGILPRILGMGSAKSKSCERRRSNGNLLVRIRAMTGFTWRRALESGGRRDGSGTFRDQSDLFRNRLFYLCPSR